MPNKFMVKLAQEQEENARPHLLEDAVKHLPWDKWVVPAFAALYAEGLDILTAQCRVVKPIFEELYQAPLPESDLPFPADDVEPLAMLEPFYQEVWALLQLALDNNERRAMVTCIQDHIVAHSDPKGKKKEGVVFTPAPIVNFINRSIQEVLIKHFGTTLSDPGVGLYDPFTGAGIFVYRLLSDPKLVPTECLLERAENILAMELMPVSAYLARLNINMVFRERLGITYDEGKEIVCQGDTFATYELIVTGKLKPGPFNKIKQKIFEHFKPCADKATKEQVKQAPIPQETSSIEKAIVTLSLEDFEHDEAIDRQLGNADSDDANEDSALLFKDIAI